MQGRRQWGRESSWQRPAFAHPLRNVNARGVRHLLVESGAKDYDLGTLPAAPPAADSRDDRLARLEAVLFLSREALTNRKLSQLASLADGTEARTLIGQLNKCYDTTGRAFRVEEVAGGYQLMTRPQFGSWLRRLYRTPVETRLSAPAAETLAVVAYRQPVVRATIEAIRGVQCGEILRQLMDRELVRIVGRSTELGRPFLYGTTKRFLELFGLKNINELPHVEQLRATDHSEAGSATATDLPALDISHLEVS